MLIFKCIIKLIKWQHTMQEDLLVDYFLERSSKEIKREVFAINITNSCSHLSCPCLSFPAFNSCAVMKLELGLIKA